MAVLISLSLLTAACGQRENGAEAPVPGAAPATSSPQAGPAATPSSVPAETASTDAVRFEPAALRVCDRPQKVTVYWDAATVPTANTVQLVAVNAAGKEALFVTAGRKGSKETGEWVRAGSSMILRNVADGSEIARATVDSIACE